ncbi:MAG: monovalent cation/H(+) antiporter subunit G [Propionibacteriaceae bacterium]
MTADGVFRLVGAACVLLGAFLAFAAAVGLVRLPDVLARMHAATKPQTLGLLLVCLGVVLSLRTWSAFATLLLVAVLQLTTAPVAAHLVSRTVYRSNQVRRDLLVRDDLATDLEAEGFHLAPVPARDGSVGDPADDIDATSQVLPGSDGASDRK